MNILVTGANGFIANNLVLHLKALFGPDIEVYKYLRSSNESDLLDFVKKSNFIFHLAGENRPISSKDYFEQNVGLTKKLCDACLQHNPLPILFSSSTQALDDNDYGRSKLEAERVLLDYSKKAKKPVYIQRLPNVFGKWCKPNYNSFLATMSYNISRGLPIEIDNRENVLNLLYIDDLVAIFSKQYKQYLASPDSMKLVPILPVYQKTLGEVFDLLHSFVENQSKLFVPPAATGFVKALYATFLSYLPVEKFTYKTKEYKDDRGSFYEILKTERSGQISLSTTKPGITRGDHFHHSKCEKFMVVKGKGLFKFRHLVTNELFEIYSDESDKKIIEVPTGYTHNFTNTGDAELIVLLWANEVYDQSFPDTQYMKV